MKAEHLPRFDASEYLDTPEAIQFYLEEAMRTGDPAFIADSIGVVARARGMTQLAKESGVHRQTLYKALSSTGSPELGTVLKVLGALGLRLAAVPAEAADPTAQGEAETEARQPRPRPARRRKAGGSEARRAERA